MSYIIDELDRSVLSLCLNGNLYEVSAMDIKPEMFKSLAARLIYVTLCDAIRKGLECDYGTVMLVLKDSDSDTKELLNSASDNPPGSHNIEFIIDRLKNRYDNAMFINQLTHALTMMKTHPLENRCPRHELLYPLLEGNQSPSKVHQLHGTLTDTMIDYIEKGIIDGGVKKLATGISYIDEKTYGGFRPPNVITIAASTGIGKTTLAINIATYMSAKGNHPLYISMEQDEKELTQKIWSCHGKIDNQAMSQFDMDDDCRDKLVDTARFLHDKMFSIYVPPENSWEKVEMTIINQVKFQCVNVVFIDYIQQFNCGGNKDLRMDLVYITNRVKQLAIKLNIPIIMMAQLNNNMDKRLDKTPILSDIKESSSITHDSDIVLILYRDYTNSKTTDRNDGKFWLKFEKNRSGDTGEREIEADLSISKFY